MSIGTGIDVVLPITTLAQQVALGDRYRKDVTSASPGSVIKLGYGIYETGRFANIVYPPNVTIVGKGPGLTVVRNGWSNNIFPGCAHECSDKTRFIGLTLENNCDVNQEGVCVGFGRSVDPRTGIGATIDNARAYLENVALIGRGFVAYIWSGINNFLDIDDSTITGGRWLLLNGRSSGSNDGGIYVRDTRFYGDSSLSTYVGRVGFRLIGVAARGGIVSAQRCGFVLRGLANMDMTAGAYIDPGKGGGIEAASPSSQIILYDSNFDVSTLGSRCGDTYVPTSFPPGRVVHSNGSGSLPLFQYKDLSDNIPASLPRLVDIRLIHGDAWKA